MDERNVGNDNEKYTNRVYVTKSSTTFAAKSPLDRPSDPRTRSLQRGIVSGHYERPTWNYARAYNTDEVRGERAQVRLS